MADFKLVVGHEFVPLKNHPRNPNGDSDNMQSASACASKRQRFLQPAGKRQAMAGAHAAAKDARTHPAKQAGKQQLLIMIPAALETSCMHQVSKYARTKLPVTPIQTRKQQKHIQTLPSAQRCSCAHAHAHTHTHKRARMCCINLACKRRYP